MQRAIDFDGFLRLYMRFMMKALLICFFVASPLLAQERDRAWVPRVLETMARDSLSEVAQRSGARVDSNSARVDYAESNSSLLLPLGFVAAMIPARLLCKKTRADLIGCTGFFGIVLSSLFSGVAQLSGHTLDRNIPHGVDMGAHPGRPLSV